MSEARRAEFREFDAESGLFEAMAVTYGTVDSHGTRWLPGVFEDSLRQQLPTTHFGHVEGQRRLVADVVDWREERTGLVVIGQLRPATISDFARRAWDGLRSKVLQDFSVVFTAQQTREGADGVPEFVKALLHRVDIVLDGSVPGAKLLSFRNAAQIGPVAARIAAAERAAGVGGRYVASTSSDLREADEILAELEG